MHKFKLDTFDFVFNKINRVYSTYDIFADIIDVMIEGYITSS